MRHELAVSAPMASIEHEDEGSTCDLDHGSRRYPPVVAWCWPHALFAVVGSPMQTPHLVVLDQFPPADIPAAAAACRTALGGMTSDHARALRSCTGIIAEGVEEAVAQALAKALSNAGTKAWALSCAMVPRLPRPLSAARLDATDATDLVAQISLTGPPQRIPWRQIVLVLPVHLHTQRTVAARKKPTVGLATAAMALTTGIGAGKVVKAMRKRSSDDAPAEVDASTRELVEIVAVGPYRRVQGYADRLDYQALAGPLGPARANFQRLLAALRDQTRPELASRSVLDAYLGRGVGPGSLQVVDNNGIAATARWMLLRGVALRLSRRR